MTRTECQQRRCPGEIEFAERHITASSHNYAVVHCGEWLVHCIRRLDKGICSKEQVTECRLYEAYGTCYCAVAFSTEAEAEEFVAGHDGTEWF